MDLRYQEYAKLLVEIGVNVQPGQDLVLACPVECAWFGRLCAQAAYDAGAREVILNWRPARCGPQGDTLPLLQREVILNLVQDLLLVLFAVAVVFNNPKGRF